MVGESTVVQSGSTTFDVAGVGNWASAHVEFICIIAFIAFIFFIFQKGGFAEKFLEYLNRKRELDVREREATSRLSEKMNQSRDQQLQLPSIAPMQGE